MVSKNMKLEALIAAYENAYMQGDLNETLRLANEVENEADRINYTNHRRLHAIHTAAEQAFENEN